MKGDNFRPVNAETQGWVLQQHFAMAELPVDAAGPVSSSSSLCARLLDHRIRLTISEGRTRAEARRLGIDEFEMPTYRQYRLMGLTPDEAINSIVLRRGRK